jgi:outer membrane cobalamin receptor
MASAAPASVTVLGADDLRARQTDSLAAALRLVPGLTVSRNGGRGALGSVFPRGGESDYTLVIVDGIRLNALGGGIDLSQLAIGNVDRVEVVRGPQSAVFGADAIGGVIDVVTARGGPIRADAQIEGGSQSTTRAVVSTAGSSAGWSWGGSVERNASDGDTGIVPATGERVSNDDWWQRQVAASAGWERSADTRIRTHLRWQESERGAPGPYGSDPIGAFSGIDRVSRGRNDDRQGSIAAAHPWAHAAGRVRQRYAASLASLDSDFTSAFGTSIFGTRRVTLRTQTDVVVGPAASLTAGIEGFGERARSTYITGAAARQVPIERTTIGGFGEWRQQIANAIALTGGLRVDRIRRAALEGSPDPFSPRPPFADDTRVSTNPRVSLVWSARSSGDGRIATRVHFSAGTGIRPPDAFEIAFTDNPSLAPERSRSIEGGVVQRGPIPGLELQATAFRNRYDDLIVAVGQSLENASRYRTDNVSNARAQGIELTGSWQPRAGISLRAGYTWLDTAILAVDRTRLAPPPFEPGDPLLRRPHHQASADVIVARDRWSGFLAMGARSHTLDVEPNLGAFGGLFRLPGYVVLDAGGTVRLRRGLDAFARVTNLMDRSYEETLGFPALGRSGMAGVRLALSR